MNAMVLRYWGNICGVPTGQGLLIKTDAYEEDPAISFFPTIFFCYHYMGWAVGLVLRKARMRPVEHMIGV